MKSQSESFRPLTPDDMKLADKVFTDYMIKLAQNETDARMKTVTYLMRVLGWDQSFALRAASIAIEDGSPIVE